MTTNTNLQQFEERIREEVSNIHDDLSAGRIDRKTAHILLMEAGSIFTAKELELTSQARLVE